MKIFDMLRVLPKSLWIMTCNSGSCNGCDTEIAAMFGPRYDIGRFGMKLVGTPRHADVLIVTGTVVKFMRDRLLRVCNQMPAPKFVVAVGDCGCSGEPLDGVIPVDVCVHGCPPRPEAIVDGMTEVVLKLESLRRSGFDESAWDAVR